MKREACFREQSLMLVFLHWSQGAFVDAEAIRSIVTDRDGNSLVISARSDELARRGDCFKNSKLFESHSIFSLPMLFLDGELHDNEESLLAHFQDVGTQMGLDITEELKGQYIEEVREASKIADRPFATRLLVLAYDDGEEIEATAPVLLVKRGGVELAVEYLLSGFNGGHQLSSHCEDIQEFVCDDGKAREFYLSPVHSEYLSWLFDTDVDVDADGFPHEVRRSTFNLNRNALDALCSRLAVPERVARVLTDAQRVLLMEQIPGELIEQPDFLGLELFQQKLPDSRVEARRTASRYHRERLRAEAQEWDAWAEGAGVVPPDGDSRW